MARENVHIMVRSTRTTHKQVELAENEYKGVRIPYEQIAEIWDRYRLRMIIDRVIMCISAFGISFAEVPFRKYLLKDVAVEIFLKDGSTHLLVFSEQKVGVCKFFRKFAWSQWLPDITIE